ncbi:ABC transporter substrate-binding protein [Marinitenerispora sediminis]|uniref:ABC transporter substrate-binding protein n=1 Tax=Marinitenerispora sediminis TaxID=1931232 RepID=A0A368T0G1_9ACTN|nr:ABC transporter substrate-binding protein [Marinitenerispora sediminis]RCV52279.1 ABC transporter substrate-binding protein [Marinitenerispora sediminis]RCV54980.1 ABC transporter substrate-binding protein [Marinitenerispora sediminis]RCV59984.1 ABC transporter substrate-binding protein [Marinitenerispora sediminis]
MRAAPIPALAAVCTLVVAAGACAPVRENDTDTLVVSTFSFATEEFERVVAEPFEERTGIRVVLDTGNNATRLTKLRINREHPDTDVVLISDYFAAIGEDMGLFEQVDPAAVPNLAEIQPWAVDPDGYGPAYTYQLLGLMYRTDLVEEPPTSWDALWDPEHPGGFALPDISVSAGPLMVLAAGEAYGSGPTDAETGFERLAEIGPDALQFYSRSTEVSSLLERGEIAMAPSLDNFATESVAAGQPIGFAVPERGRLMTANTARIVAGAPNRAGAEAFIDFLLEPEVQSQMAEAFFDKPVHPDAEVPDLMTQVSGDAAVDPAGNGYRQGDLDLIAGERSAWLDRYVEEVER